MNITAQVNHFTDAQIEQLMGDGVLNKNSATSYTFDLGTVAQGQGELAAELGVTNDALAQADDLSGDFDLDANVRKEFGVLETK